MNQKNSGSDLFGALLAATIHEIKNRFGLLYNDLDTLLGELPTTEAQQGRVESIKSEAQFVGSELVRVLASYKSLAGNFALNIDQQFAIEFLEEAIARHSYTFRAHNIQAKLECDEETSGFFDMSIATIVLDTLLYNAIKAGANQLLLTAHEDDQYLYMEVHDNGPGFPQNMLESDIQQSNVSIADKSTGLGLYFAQQLLASHRDGNKEGQLILGTSDKLGGAKVTLQIPH